MLMFFFFSLYNPLLLRSSTFTFYLLNHIWSERHIYIGQVCSHLIISQDPIHHLGTRIYLILHSIHIFTWGHGMELVAASSRADKELSWHYSSSFFITWKSKMYDFGFTVRFLSIQKKKKNCWVLFIKHNISFLPRIIYIITN